ncbi:MAG: SPASM domain-containing protein, partial [Dysgonamonadaceae bacterium]|nr:SPASM domain-containing protein [Dysgonamonadaceae bacterium]
KKQYSSEFPRLNWVYIIFEHNDTETELRAAIKLASELGMVMCFRNAWNGYRTRNAEMLSKEGFSVGIVPQGVEALFFCSMLWTSPQINWDGRFFGCCCNARQAFDTDNAFSVKLEKILASPAVVATKQMLTGKGIDRNSPCLSCGHYKTMQAQGQVIDENLELKFSPKVFVKAKLKGILRRVGRIGKRI